MSPRNRRIVLLLAVVLLIPSGRMLAGPIDVTWRDVGPTENFRNIFGQENNFIYAVDTHLIVSNDTFQRGDTLTFDYTQTYLMDSTRYNLISGAKYGTPEIVPGNLFPTETRPSRGDSLIPKHFEHDLFVEGPLQFGTITSATLKTNSPAPNGINQVTIGPVGVGLTVSGVGDTTYNAHATPSKTYLDWVTTNQQGGFFFNGSSISFKGTLIATGAGTAELFTDNTIWESGHSTFNLLAGNNFSIPDDKMLNNFNVRRGVKLDSPPPLAFGEEGPADNHFVYTFEGSLDDANPVPAPPSWLLLSIGALAPMGRAWGRWGPMRHH